MTNADFNTLAHALVQYIRDNTPRDTGNLADDATKIKAIDSDSFEIYVDEVQAPYFKYVNNYETFIRKGKEVPNRNYEYFKKACEKAVENIAKDYGGYVKDD